MELLHVIGRRDIDLRNSVHYVLTTELCFLRSSPGNCGSSPRLGLHDHLQIQTVSGGNYF